MWSPQDIVDNSHAWNLECDAKLLGVLERLSEDLEQRCRGTNERLCRLEERVETAGLLLKHATNQLLGLHNVRFVEKRVAEDEDEPQVSQVEVGQPAAEDDLRAAILAGLEVVDRYHEQIQVPDTDSEDDESTIDPYLDRPLPQVIGSDEWNSSHNVGLLDSASESASPEMYSDDDDDVDDEEASLKELAFESSSSDAALDTSSPGIAGRHRPDLFPEELARPVPKRDIFSDNPPPLGNAKARKIGNIFDDDSDADEDDIFTKSRLSDSPEDAPSVFALPQDIFSQSIAKVKPVAPLLSEEPPEIQSISKKDSSSVFPQNQAKAAPEARIQKDLKKKPLGGKSLPGSSLFNDELKRRLKQRSGREDSSPEASSPEASLFEGDEASLFSPPQKTALFDDVPPPINTSTREKKYRSLFGDDDDDEDEEDDLFSPRKPAAVDELDDAPLTRKPVEKKEFFPEEPPPLLKKSPKSLFDDYGEEDDDLFKKTNILPEIGVAASKGLFDDDDDDDDLFSSFTPKKKVEEKGTSEKEELKSKKEPKIFEVETKSDSTVVDKSENLGELRKEPEVEALLKEEPSNQSIVKDEPKNTLFRKDELKSEAKYNEETEIFKEKSNSYPAFEDEPETRVDFKAMPEVELPTHSNLKNETKSNAASKEEPTLKEETQTKPTTKQEPTIKDEPMYDEEPPSLPSKPKSPPKSSVKALASNLSTKIAFGPPPGGLGLMRVKSEVNAEPPEEVAASEGLRFPTKSRARGPVQRRPSTRKARHEAARRSGLDQDFLIGDGVHLDGRGDDIQGTAENSRPEEKSKLKEESRHEEKSKLEEKFKPEETSRLEEKSGRGEKFKPKENKIQEKSKPEEKTEFEKKSNSEGKSSQAEKSEYLENFMSKQEESKDEPIIAPKNVPATRNLFLDSDDGEDDFFSKVQAAKVKPPPEESAKKPKEDAPKATSLFEDDKDDLFSSRVTPKAKPLFEDEDQDLFASKEPPRKAKPLFEDDEDLFSAKTSKSLFEEPADLFSAKKKTDVPAKKSTNLFGDSDGLFAGKKKAAKTSSLFSESDSDGDDLFKPKPQNVKKSEAAAATASKPAGGVNKLGRTAVDYDPLKDC